MSEAAMETEQSSEVETPTAETQVEQTFDREALELKVSEGMAAVFGDEAEDDEADGTPEPSADETQSGSEGEPASDTEEDDEETETEESQEEPEAAAESDDTAPTLPDAYRRSLKAYDWTDEDIDANLKALGHKFIETAQRIHANRNAEVAQWAAAGRAARNQQQQQPPATGQAAPASGPQALQPVDVTKLKEQYGDDELIDAIVNPVNAAIEQINAIVPQIQHSQQAAQMAELEALGRQVEAFFTGDDLKPYREIYGDASKTLAPQQIEARNKVLELADALVIGMKLQGRKVSLSEALTLAHDSVAGEFKVKQAKAEIKGALKKREKGITLKPGNKKPAAREGVVRTRSDLERKVAQGLRGVFGG